MKFFFAIGPDRIRSTILSNLGVENRLISFWYSKGQHQEWMHDYVASGRIPFKERVLKLKKRKTRKQTARAAQRAVAKAAKQKLLPRRPTRSTQSQVRKELTT